MIGILLVSASLLGLLVGSFLNVVAHRVPAGLSVVSPGSACPGCRTPIAARDNVPLLSWLVLRGRCRHCSMAISARYPAVEAMTAGAFLLAALPFLPRDADVPAPAELIELLAFLYLAAISVVLAVIDLDVRRLPDVLVLPGYLVGAVLLGAADLLDQDPTAAGRAAAGAGLAVLFFAVLWFVKPGGMGLGDVKLAGLLGLFLGHLGAAQLVVGIAAGFVLGGMYGLVLLAVGRAGRGATIPFGPWMILGAWVGVLAGEPLARAYLRLIGLA